MIGLIPYIGGKHRIAPVIGEHLRATGAETLVEVFGGSAAVMLSAGFAKRVYNDADGDLVNLFRVIADNAQRRKLLRLIRLAPCSRRIFEDHYRDYLHGGFSFSGIADPVERAFRVYYRLQFAFGGKLRTGGYTLSTANRPRIKELQRYRNGLRKITRLCQFFRDTAIENLDYQALISVYGKRSHCVLFCDPPYLECETYYSRRFARADHVFLAEQLTSCAAPVVCTYYDSPLIRDLYPNGRWTWTPIKNVKNSQRRGGQKTNATDWIISKA